jgi:hypothetical protein
MLVVMIRTHGFAESGGDSFGLSLGVEAAKSFLCRFQITPVLRITGRREKKSTTGGGEGACTRSWYSCSIMGERAIGIIEAGGADGI